MEAGTVAIQPETQILKYAIPPTGLRDIFGLMIPQDAQFLSCQVQSSDIVMWFATKPTDETVTRSFCIVGTGMSFADAAIKKPAKFLATLQLHNGLVVHIFELTSGQTTPS